MIHYLLKFNNINKFKRKTPNFTLPLAPVFSEYALPACTSSSCICSSFSTPVCSSTSTPTSSGLASIPLTLSSGSHAMKNNISTFLVLTSATYLCLWAMY